MSALLVRDGVIPQGAIDGRQYRSETGQIELSADSGTMKVVTEKSECFVIPVHEALCGNRVSVRNASTVAAVMVIAVDGKNLDKSERILVLHLTDGLNTGMRFLGKGHRHIEDLGGFPHLVRQGTVEIELDLPQPASWEAWGLDCSGARQNKIALGNHDGHLILPADTHSPTGACLAYEIIRHKD